ncbi:uncharacterized protein LOC133844148 [Drosophila sulfurigaster albostrigata]|uniref:uncharacterized protein LOC133844148 n=1 Tax=Drosophila sulfurigaster albostrigata TaxID=89887 RepID=UPI002D21DD92|nr:uncharacterized protein LOC133844148 [Drosophila sulfurigaster albostrigata]
MSPLNACLLIPVVVAYLLLLLDNQVCGDANFAILNNKSLPGKCYMETDKGPLIIESEQLVRHPLKCENIFCGRESWALIFTCSPRSVPQGCVVTDYIDSNAAYPECCERDWVCNDIV